MKMTAQLPFFILCFAFCACEKDQTQSVASANKTFEKTFGGESEDLANSIAIQENALYILGQSKSFNDANGDHYLIKLNVDGNLIFEKTYGGNSTEVGTKILPSNDGNFILVGTTESIGNGKKDIHVLKVDRDGNVLWEKSFGGVLDDAPNDIIETTHSEFCIAATTQSFGAGSRDMYLIWMDQNGNLVREKTFGGSDMDGSSALIEIENNQLMLYGYTRNFGANGRDLYLMKLTAQGDSLWSKRYGGIGYEASQGFAQTSSGGFLMNGHSSSIDPLHNMYAVEVDSNGNVLWENNYGGDAHDGGEDLLINKEGHYVFMARSMSFGNGDRNIYLVTTAPSGNPISEKVIGASQNDWGEDIIEFDSFYFIVGHSNSFGAGDNDVYVVKLEK